MTDNPTKANVPSDQLLLADCYGCIHLDNGGQVLIGPTTGEHSFGEPVLLVLVSPFSDSDNVVSED